MPNKVSRAMRAKAAADGKLPHELLLQWARGDELIEDVVVVDGNALTIKRKPAFDERVRCATAAAPFYAPKLAQVENNGTVEHGISSELRAVVQRLHAEGAGRIRFAGNVVEAKLIEVKP